MIRKSLEKMKNRIEQFINKKKRLLLFLLSAVWRTISAEAVGGPSPTCQTDRRLINYANFMLNCYFSHGLT